MNPKRGSAWASAALAALALSGMPTAGSTEHLRTAMSEAPAPQQTREQAVLHRRQREAEALRRETRRLTRGWRYPKPGHSVRQGQRMALKSRNRALHKSRIK